MNALILNDNAKVVSMTIPKLVQLIAEGTATQIQADSLTLSIVGQLMASLTSAGLTDPSKLTAAEARVLLDKSEATRMHARQCVGLLQKNYPSSAMALSNALTVGLFAEATIIPALMLGNIDVLDGKRTGVNTYIVKSSESGLIKIGRSISPYKRIRSLETGAGCKLQVLAIIKKDIESKLHKQFSDLRAFGEWFLDDGRIAVYASEVKA